MQRLLKAVARAGHQAGVVAGHAGATNQWAHSVNTARNGLTDDARKRAAAIPGAAHAGLVARHECDWNRIQLSVCFQRKSWPQWRVIAAGSTGLAIEIRNVCWVLGQASSRATRIDATVLCCYCANVRPFACSRCPAQLPLGPSKSIEAQCLDSGCPAPHRWSDPCDSASTVRPYLEQPRSNVVTDATVWLANPCSFVSARITVPRVGPE
jgi:hypothetical protein